MNHAMQAEMPRKFLAARVMEHRWGQRRPCRACVRVTSAAGFAGDGELRNVSMSGAYLMTPMPLPLFSRLTVAVYRRDGSRHAEYTATVARRDDAGVGIEWLEASEGPVCRMLGCADECAFSGHIRD
ncbi:MAG TPA: PilZ domain-containing protein [Steroidobacteraceae bacterium]|jgi:hypothetical protein|nr:PilZ domain-containing protein [Steroidobacteraceae bacterium]